MDMPEIEELTEQTLEATVSESGVSDAAEQERTDEDEEEDEYDEDNIEFSDDEEDDEEDECLSDLLERFLVANDGVTTIGESLRRIAVAIEKVQVRGFPNPNRRA